MQKCINFKIKFYLQIIRKSFETINENQEDISDSGFVLGTILETQVANREDQFWKRYGKITNSLLSILQRFGRFDEATELFQTISTLQNSKEVLKGFGENFKEFSQEIVHTEKMFKPVLDIIGKFLKKHNDWQIIQLLIFYKILVIDEIQESKRKLSNSRKTTETLQQTEERADLLMLVCCQEVHNISSEKLSKVITLTKSFLTNLRDFHENRAKTFDSILKKL